MYRRFASVSVAVGRPRGDALPATKLRHRRPSPALVVSTPALAVAMAGTGYAAFSLPKNSVGSKLDRLLEEARPGDHGAGDHQRHERSAHEPLVLRELQQIDSSGWARTTDLSIMSAAL